MILRTCALVLVSLSAPACDRCGSDPKADETEPTGRPADDTPDLAESDWFLDDSTDSPEAAGADQPRDRTAKLRATIEEAVGGAMQQMAAAVQVGIAAEQGDTPCERAFTGMSAMIVYLAANAPNEMAKLKPPTRAEFLPVCHGLDADMQRCMQLSYGMEHQEECQRVHASQPPEVMERLQSVTVRGAQ
jgi:hypothetical protein